VESCNFQGRGHCPSCRAYFQLCKPKKGTKLKSSQPAAIKEELLSLSKATIPVGQCGMCLQQRELPPGMRGLCAKCDLGQTLALRYECNRCHKTQMIPHPMFSYQASPTTYSSATWACHQRCGDYTKWRIVPEDMAKIPVAHCPAEWGPQEAWLQQIAEQSRRPG